jgi:hypothetical protein
VFAGGVAAVVEGPQFGALAARVPGAELVAEGEDAFLGAGLLLVAAAAAEDRVEAARLDAVEQGLRSPSGRSRSRPSSMKSWTEAMCRRSPCFAAMRSRYSMTSGKLWPVSTCSSAKGTGAGQKAFSARCSMTMESLPPEKRITGRSNSPATSRKMCTASASRASRCESA